MNNEYAWRIGRKCVFKNTIHLVFVTKYMDGVFTPAMLKRVYSLVKETCEQMEVTLHDCRGDSDYLYILLTCPPKLAVSHLIGKLKGKTSYFLRKEFSAELQGKLKGVCLWSPSYCLVSDHQNALDEINCYINAVRQPSLPRYMKHSIAIRGDRHPKRRARVKA